MIPLTAILSIVIGVTLVCMAVSQHFGFWTPLVAGVVSVGIGVGMLVMDYCQFREIRRTSKKPTHKQR